MKFNGTDVTVSGEEYSFIMPAAAVEVTATFTAIDYEITYAASENGTVSGQTTAKFGEKVVLTVAPAEGYELKLLTVDGAVINAVDGVYSFDMPAKNVVVKAEFAKKMFKVDISKTIKNGKVFADNVGDSIAWGTEVTVTLVPDMYYKTKFATVNTTPLTLLSEGTAAKFTVTGNSTISAEFERIMCDLSITSTGGGKVTANVGTSVEMGTSVTLTVTADKYHVLASLTVNDEVVDVVDGKYTFFLVEETTVKAVFEREVHILSIGYSEGGIVTAQPAEPKCGDEVVLTVDPANGYKLKALTVNNNVVDVVDGKYTFLFDMDTEVYAEFVGVESAITTETAKNGSITAPENGEFGKKITVTAKPDDGYYLSGLQVLDSEGKDLEIDVDIVFTSIYENVATFVMPAQDITLVPTFTETGFKPIYIHGEIEGKTITGDSKQIVTVTEDTILSNNAHMYIAGKLYVPAGVTLTIGSDATLEISGYADIRGNIVVSDAEEGKSPGFILVTGQADIFGNVIIDGIIGTYGNGRIFIKSDAAEPTTGADSGAVIGESGAVFGNITIENDASMTVNGALGFIYNSEYVRTDFTVAGTLTINTMVPTEGFDIALSGNGKVEIEKVLIGKTSVGKIDEKVAGSIKIMDAGIYYIDAKGNKMPMKDSSNEMVFNVMASFSNIPELESDVSYAYGALITGVIISAETSTAVIGDKDVSESDYKGQTRYSSVLTISGNVAIEGYTNVDVDAPEAKVEMVINAEAYNNPKTGIVVGETTIGSNIEMIMEGPVTVTGSVTVSDKAKVTNNGMLTVKAPIDSRKGTFENVGTMTVSGDGSVAVKLKLNGKINSALYTVKEDKDTVHYYVTVDAAIAALNAGIVKSIEVHGEQTLVASASVPSNAIITLVDSTLTIGEEKVSDVRLEFLAGSKTALVAKGESKVVVNGSLYADKMANIGKLTIESDVMNCTKKADNKPDTSKPAEWTNIYNAVANAKDGSTIDLARDVTIDRNLAIRATITLDACGYALTVDSGVILTVSGTLDLMKEDSKVVLVSEDKTGKVVAGTIVVEGYVVYNVDGKMLDYAPIYDGTVSDDSRAKIAGAYYAITDSKNKKTNYLTSYVNGFADAAKADALNQFWAHYVVLEAGKDGKIQLGDVSITGENGKNALVEASADIVVGKMTLTNAAFTNDGNHNVVGAFFGADGSVSVSAMVDNFFFLSVMMEGANTTVLSGSFADTDGQTHVDFGGTVHLDEAKFSVDKVTVPASAGIILRYVDEGKDVRAEVQFLEGCEVVIDGTVTISKKSKMTADSLTVNGSVAVEDGELVVGNATVLGSIIATAMDEGGKFIASAYFEKLYVGISAGDYLTTGAVASVTGNVVVYNHALVAPGSTVPEAFTKEKSDYSATAFMLDDGTLYITGYAGNKCDLEIGRITYSKTDARFDGWYYGKDSADDKMIGYHPEVTAKMTYEIYSLTVRTDGGINYITVNGILLETKDGITFYTAYNLKAGTYKVDFGVKSGYDRSDVKMYTSEGVAVDLGKIVLSGATVAPYKGIEKVDYQLVGSSPYNPDNPPIIIKPEDTSLTEKLLIVLVVLIVIMAILVATRLMRS